MSRNSLNSFGFVSLVNGLILLGLIQNSQAQIPGVEARFLADSVEVGRPFVYTLWVRHSPRQEVLFPDTVRQFAPYVVQSMVAFPTLTTGDISRDSAVYTLISFETDLWQTLAVPVRLLNGTDTLTLRPAPATLRLRSRLNRADTTAPAALTLTPDLAPQSLRQEFNYPVLASVLLIVGATLSVFYALFGRVLRQRWRRYQLYRRHNRFLQTYGRLIRSLNADTAADTASQAIGRWKQYLEQLENEPFLSLTTREISERLQSHKLADALREVDQVIYGGTFSEQLPVALYLLRDVATQTYRRRLKTIHNQPLVSAKL
jgi:hypothetical protein